MTYRYILLLALGLMVNCVHAQIINPADLLKLYQNTLVKEAKFGLSAYKQIRSVDDRWNLGGKPSEDDHGITVLYNFSMDRKSWYQPDAYMLMISQQYGPPEIRSVLYRFKEQSSWDAYLQQMELMKAVLVSTRKASGGQETLYSVSDINFVLADYPPGINGTDRTYQVTISHIMK